MFKIKNRQDAAYVAHRIRIGHAFYVGGTKYFFDKDTFRSSGSTGKLKIDDEKMVDIIYHNKINFNGGNNK